MTSLSQLEAGALDLIRTLVRNYGGELVQAVLVQVLGPGQLIEPVSLLIGDVLRAVLAVVDESRVRELVSAQYDAADLAADAAIAAKFGK